MAGNRQDERAAFGEYGLRADGFSWLRDTVPLKVTPPAPQAAEVSPENPAGEMPFPGEEEAALYLFGGREERDRNADIRETQITSEPESDFAVFSADIPGGAGVFPQANGPGQAGCAAPPDSDPAPELALEGDPGEADQGIAEEDDGAVAALGCLLGKRQDVPPLIEENVHTCNNINENDPESGTPHGGAASAREEDADPAPEEEEDDADTEVQEGEGPGRGTGRPGVRRFCLIVSAVLVSGTAVWYAMGSGRGESEAGLPTTAAEAELVRRQAGALRALPQAEDGSGGPMPAHRVADGDKAAASAEARPFVPESGPAQSASGNEPSASVRPAMTDAQPAAGGEPLLAESDRPATAGELKNGFAALREDLKRLGESISARQAGGEEDIRALRRAARDLQAAVGKYMSRADVPAPGLSDLRKAGAGGGVSLPSGGLEGWSVLGLSATRAIVQDPGGRIWTVAKGDRAGRLKIRDVDLATGNVSTDRGVIRYSE